MLSENNSKNGRMIVLGGSGFVGSSLIDRLWREGYGNIVNISADKTHPNKDIEQYVVNISDDILKDIIEVGDCIVHLAESSTPATAEIDRIKDVGNSLIGTIKLLDLCAQKKIGKFIYASSGGTVYGEGGRPFKETDATIPLNSYGALKLSIEHYLAVYSHLYGFDHTIMRIGNIYGRKDLGGKQPALDVFVRNIFEDKKITINGDGNTIRDYIHIKDVVDFMIFAVQDEQVKGIFNIGTGVGTSLNDLAFIIEKVTGKKVEIDHLPARTQDLKYNVLDVEKAMWKKWAPKIKLEDGIRELYNTLKSNAK